MGVSRKLLCSGIKVSTSEVILSNTILSLPFLNLGHNMSFSRSQEEDLEEKLDGFVSVPQEWHKKKVWNNRFNC